MKQIERKKRENEIVKSAKKTIIKIYLSKLEWFITKCFLNEWKLMPCPFTGPKTFFARPNFLCQPKNLTACSASTTLLCQHKKQSYWMQIIFLSGTKFLWLPQNVNKSLIWHKKFGTAQNILWPVKGQGISVNRWKIAKFTLP